MKSWLFVVLLVLSGNALALGGDFTLRSSDGSDYSLHDSRGKVVVLSFGYTFCPDICPTALATVAAAMSRLGDDAERVDALFVSLDPDRDTPEHLREYTRFFYPEMKGLTGDAEQIREIAQRYRVRYAFVGKGVKEHYTLDHSANLFIIDTRGKLFRIIPYGMPPRALEDGLRMALRLGKATDPSPLR